MVLEIKRLVFVSLLFMLAMLALVGVTGIPAADANQCAADCYAQQQACLQESKGNPSCNAQLTSCLQSCR